MTALTTGEVKALDVNLIIYHTYPNAPIADQEALFDRMMDWPNAVIRRLYGLCYRKHYVAARQLILQYLDEFKPEPAAAS